MNNFEIIRLAKSEIEEIWKSQNIIDVRTPSFINVTLDIDETNDLYKLQNNLSKIDVIDQFNVIELNNEFAKIKIKYFGKIDKIKSKFIEQGIKVIIVNNQWKLKLI